MFETKTKARQDELNRRIQMILPLLDEELTRRDRIELQKKISQTSGLSYRTISRCVEKYKNEGIDGLKPCKRKRVLSRSIDEEVLSEAITLRRELPSRSVKDIILILELEGKVKEGQISRSTLQRYMQNEGFSKKQMMLYATPKGGSSHSRFQKRHRMESLQGDIKYGPYLPLGRDGKLVQTYWIGWIDDCSRYITYGRFYEKQTAREVMDSLMYSTMAAGKPKKIVLDNGRQYRSSDFLLACSILGKKIVRAKPYSPQVKGKIEAYNRHLDKFIEEARLTRYRSLNELNEAYEAWQENYYHKATHSSLNGRCPKEVFFNDTAKLETVDDEILKEAFSFREERIVNKDGSIQYDGCFYEVENPAFIGHKVLVTSLCCDDSRIKVYKNGYAPCDARKRVISDNVNFPANITMKGVIQAERSRMLDALQEDYAHSLEEKGIKETSFLSFSDSEEERGGNS